MIVPEHVKQEARVIGHEGGEEGGEEEGEQGVESVSEVPKKA